MRYLLDANVISNIVKPLPSDPLIAWMAEQADQDLFHRFTRGGHGSAEAPAAIMPEPEAAAARARSRRDGPRRAAAA